MKDMAEQEHILKYGNGDDPQGDYDVAKVTHLVESIQAMCGDIYNDRTLHPKLKMKQEELAWEIHENPTE